MSAGGEAGVRALDGVRVVELSIGIAAPFAGRILAHHGADVLKIESPTAPETIRLMGSPWARSGESAEVFVDTSPLLAEFSAGKRSVGVELKDAAGLEVARRLIAASDVLLTNLSAPAVRRLGLGYDEVRAMRPDIVYAGVPGFGFDESLPYHRYVSWGPNQAPLVGLDDLTGEPGREPCGITSTAPPDYVGALHATLAILAALEHRDATGEGCFIDIAQFQTTASLLGTFVADHERHGTVPERTGNRHAVAAPSGVYPCRGRTSHVAITVGDDEAWLALTALMDGAEWASDARFATAEGRRGHHDEIDEALAAWTEQHSADEVASWLQHAGVAAYPVLDGPGLLADPQLRDRGWYVVRSGLRFERDVFADHPIRLSATPGRTDVAGPALGEHTREVLRDVAGYSGAEVEDLLARAVAHEPARPELRLRRPYDAQLGLLGLVP